MITPFNMLNRLVGTIPGFQESMPLSIRGVQESFMSGGHWIFWLCLMGPAAVLLGSAWWWWQQHRHEKQKRIINNPQKLFKNLLAKVKLTADDKELLREITKTGRLRHPAMSLLSPELLDVSHRAWLAEKKDKITPQKLKRIEAISISLYDQPTPSGVQRMKESI